ncbi:MAG: helix-hairpin-helix domain-containing protein [Dysgonamonadaceae bacterium]|jgi:hypothetical protein|nr:helix-hairpin-helix domain-containing protein [Dysgonamonadaceae bacterium]
MKPLFIIILSFIISELNAQINFGNTEWMQYPEELAASEETGTSDLEQIFDELSYLSEHPFNLHTVTKKDLERLPFLTDIQIENLLYYLYKYSPLVDIYELKNVEAMDLQTITYLLPFVYVGDTVQPSGFRWKNIFRYGKQEAMIRSDYTFQKKAGYQKTSPEETAANPNKHYLGEPYYLSLRYGFNDKDIQWGFAAEKDAGEAFWNKHHKGFDHYAFNVNLKNRGILENLHIGDYRLSFGQGLVMNTNFSTGKTSFITNINQTNESIKRHASPSETGFFRGLAGALKFNNLQINLFYSHRKQDANADSATVYSFKTDGYNRIPGDIDRRKTATVDMGGSHIRWRNESFHLGLTFVYCSFGGKRLNPDPKPYNLFYLRGKSHFNTGMNYGFGGKRFSFKGETAWDAAGKWATVNNLLINPASSVNLIFSYRNYARDYNAFYAKAFSESSGVRNETGFYAGIKFHPFPRWELSAYADYFRFPWLRYGVHSPSSGVDGLVQAVYKPDGNWQMQLRYKYKEKEKNAVLENGNKTFILPYQQQRWQFRLDYRLKNWELKTQADYNRYTGNRQSQSGWLLTQTAGFSPDKSKCRIDGGWGYFHTGDRNSRIGIYEKNILYAFHYPDFYGEGLRLYMIVKWKIAPALTIYLKMANTRYFDRNVIGSDLEEIQGRDKTDAYCLLRYVW